ARRAVAQRERDGRQRDSRVTEERRPLLSQLDGRAAVGNVDVAETQARDRLLVDERAMGRGAEPPEEVHLDRGAGLPVAADLGSVEHQRQARVANVAAAEPAVDLAIRW